eukprot:TRINITY_DN5294_c1_g2_i1.p2 TRINITY_DN5294_c1_g2~~TRINITY_DN5294_c1_g2_i1.p2  ORF type:complete len:444 (+),score=138.77 TRINITY_DN5294_c1_g2_i1:72-1334(+)
MAGAGTMQLERETEDALAGKIEAAPEQEHAEDVLCPMCTQPAFFCPVKTVSCGHMFHKSCLEDWLKGKVGAARRCPMCSKELPAGSAHVEVDISVRAILDRLKVNCPQRCEPEPTPKRMRYDQLAPHIRECPMTPMLCGSAGCGVVLPRKDMEVHAAACEHALIACGQCKEKMRRGILQGHAANDCKHRRYTCASCKQGDLLVCQMREHELQCSGPVQMSALAELRQQHREQQERNRELLEKAVAELQQQNRELLDSNRELLKQTAAEAKKQRKEAQERHKDFECRMITELTQQRSEIAELRQQNQSLLGIVRTMQCSRIKVTSAERPHCDGKYRILQEKRNGHSVWRSADGGFVYRNPVGSWVVCDDRDSMSVDEGVLRLTNEQGVSMPLPVASGRWEHWAGQWVPAPCTSIEVVVATA